MKYCADVNRFHRFNATSIAIVIECEYRLENRRKLSQVYLKIAINYNNKYRHMYTSMFKRWFIKLYKMLPIQVKILFFLSYTTLLFGRYYAD